jgi:hypothetical protein
LRLPPVSVLVDAGDAAQAPQPRAPDRPAAVMVVAPVLGLAIWAGILLLVL